jgi:flagellar basal body-associated protein FliL
MKERVDCETPQNVISKVRSDLRGMWILLIALLGILTIGVAGYFALSGHRDQAPQREGPSSPTGQP